MKIKRKSKVEPKDSITILSEAVIRLQEQVAQLQSKASVSFEDEFKDLLKQGKIRFDVQTHDNGWGSAEIVFDIYVNGDWVVDFRDTIKLPEVD
jgi:hypothetical protein